MSDNTRRVRIARGSGANLGRAKSHVYTWPDFCRLFDDPPRTSETHRAYLKMPKDDQDRLKSIDGWYLGGAVESGRRRRKAVAERDVITLDIDECSPEFFAEIRAGLDAIDGLAYVAHTTRKHEAERPRLRMNFLLDRPIERDHYDAAARVLAWHIDPTLDTFDDVSFRPAQMMFMPTRSSDQEYLTWTHDGEPLDARAMLDEWPSDWRDFTNLPFSQSRGQKRPPQEKAEDPWQKRGIVGAFCRAWTIEEAIEKFLPNVYAPGQDSGGKPRYTWLPGSTANGVVVEDDGRFIYSHHGTDPCSDQLCNAFDMVRLHMFGELDLARDLAGVDITEHPSFKRMTKFARDDRRTQEEMIREEIDVEAMFDDVSDMDDEETERARTVYVEGTSAEDQAIEDLLGESVPAMNGLPPYPGSKPPPRPEKGWAKTLEPTAEGKVKVSLTNIATIIMNDPRLYRSIARNTFSNHICARRPIKSKLAVVPDIDIEDREDGLEWSDEHDASIRAILEAPSGEGKPGYGIRVTDRDLRSGILLTARHWQYHPIIEHLVGLEHDGVPRLETLWHDYLGCEDSAYHRETAVLFLVGAISRLFHPGHKFDWVPIMTGEQGARKSTFVSVLFFEKWFGELTTEMVSNKDAVEQMLGAWCLELGELESLTRSEVEAQKAFISRREDRVRLAYDRRMSTFPRQCVFMGTTNAHEYLRDDSNRRFWPLEVRHTKARPIDTARLARERDQIWAEALDRYREMCTAGDWRNLVFGLSPEADREAEWRQEHARLESYGDMDRAMIEDWLETPVRLSHLRRPDGFEDLDAASDPMVLRSKICSKQIAEEVLDLEATNSRQRAYAPRIIGEIMAKLPGWTKSRSKLHIPGYGRHRAWVRQDAGPLEIVRGYRETDDQLPEDIL